MCENIGYKPKDDFTRLFNEAQDDSERFSVVCTYKDILDFEIWIDKNDLYLEFNDNSTDIFQFNSTGNKALSLLLEVLKIKNTII